jgi:hypothetical protein
MGLIKTDDKMIYIESEKQIDPGIYDLGIPAIERFGTDVEAFKEAIKKYSPESSKRTSEKFIKDIPSSLFYGRYSGNYLELANYTLYRDTLIKIVQVNLEIPGFIKNFPEAIEYIDDDNYWKLKNKFRDSTDDVIENYNRFSGRYDKNFILKTFGAPDKDIRFDEWVAVNFKEHWESGDKTKRGYLKKYYLYLETLLPKDYNKILDEAGIETKDIDIESLDIVDFYFSEIDNLVENLKKNVRLFKPSTLRKLNSTLIGWKNDTA